MPPRRRNQYLSEGLLRLIILLFLLGGVAAIAYWSTVPDEGRRLSMIAAILGLLSGIGATGLLFYLRKRRRTLAWQRAMAAWNNPAIGSVTPRYQDARNLSARSLEKFAAQVYTRLGYQVVHTGQSGDHGVDVRLVNPKGEVELVQCKQWNKPVGEPEVRDLYGSMAHEQAPRGYIWAPGGFSEAARLWVEGKPIRLMDNDEIGRLVEIAYR